MASTSGTNTVRDNSILPHCNVLYLSFNGLLSPPPPLHSKKFPLIYYQVLGRQIDSTSFNISSDLQLSNDKPHQCHCPGYLTAKMKIQKHKSHADKKTAPFVPPIHSYSIKLPKPILSAIPTKKSDISNILWTGTLATKTQTTCWLSSTLEWRLSPMNGSNMFCSRNSVSNNVDDVDNDDGGDDDDGDGYPQMIPWVLLKRSSRKYWEKVN